MTLLERYSYELQRLPPPLSREEESKASVDQLVRHNLRFAYRAAYRRRDRGVPLEDLVSAANAGLVEAARRFKPLRGTKFITYAAWWVEHEIRLELYNAQIVRLPRRRWNRGEKLQVSGLDREEALGTADPALGRVADGITVREMLSTVTRREARILELYYGLNGDRHTLEEIGNVLGVTRERIRQKLEAEAKSLRRLRLPPGGGCPGRKPVEGGVSLDGAESGGILAQEVRRPGLWGK